MSKTELKPLKFLQTESGIKVAKYVKQVQLVELDEPKVPMWKKIIRVLTWNTNPMYNGLTDLQKRLLHTIAPLWANILQHNMHGNMVVTDDAGNKYDLNAMKHTTCLVGEVNGFGDTRCRKCSRFNMGFASLNDPGMRNTGYLGMRADLSNFLDHYYDQHWNK